jgi:hypothetical protein
MLGYVIYTDNKGVKRKETSWNSWKDNKIETQDFDNEPTSGFVLNKTVGGGRGWDGRATYARIYDPRNFEFEITIPNLLFILEECSSIKGKGLEGEFVYAWDKADLVLLPVTSQEYKLSSGHTALQTQVVTKDNMKEGYTYLNKDGHKVMYLGRHIYNQTDSFYREDGEKTGGRYRSNTDYINTIKSKRKHIFVDLDDNNRYWVQDGFVKIASIISSDISELFASEYDKFKHSFEGSVEVKLTKLPATKQEIIDQGKCYGSNFFIDCGKNITMISMRHSYGVNKFSENSELDKREAIVDYDKNELIYVSNNRNTSFYDQRYYYNKTAPMLVKEIQEENFFKLVYVNNYNEQFKLR